MNQGFETWRMEVRFCEMEKLGSIFCILVYLQNSRVMFGGMEKLPIGSISCILVYLENGSKVWWDGETRLYILYSSIPGEWE